MRNMIPDKTDVLIAGAGIAGCAAAQFLQANGMDYLLVEKNVDPGGLTRSITIGEAHFDYTGHFMHLSRCKTPAGIPFARQNDEDWNLIKRKSMVFLEGAMIPAPFQYNLFYLSANIKDPCIQSYRSRSNLERISSFKEYLLSGFGQGICDYFLFPYNQKMMDCPLDTLSVDAVKRFFPMPDEKRIEKGYAQEGANPDTGYNCYFWYPKRQGIGLLAKGLAQGLNSLYTICPVERIDLASRQAWTSSGIIHYKRLVTSLPLKAFCMLTNDPTLHELSESLRHTRVFCMNIMIRGSMPKFFDGCHWIYVPEPGIPFYRVGIYSHISPQITPKGATSLYVETALSDRAPLPVMSQLIEGIFSGLERLGWVKRADCLILSVNWIDYAYVHFDHARQENVRNILEILRNYNVYPIGRYGLWDYISMEDAILTSIETIKGLPD